MTVSFLTTLDQEALQTLLRSILLSILKEAAVLNHSREPEILDIKQAAQLLHLQPSTLYEKTSERSIPHFKKGNKVYFNRTELLNWVEAGRVTPLEELQSKAAGLVHARKRNKKEF